jgi:hypothetical protein
MPRKRAPGAGRKPAGPISGKLSNFSTRITHDTRVGLEAEAAMSRQSISQVAEQMIALGLATKREREQPSPTQAICFLVGQLADSCSALFGDKKFSWNTDAFAFDAFAFTMRLLLERLRPSDSELSRHLREGKDVDELDREMFASPESWAKHQFYRLWDELMGIQHSLPVELPTEEQWETNIKKVASSPVNKVIFMKGDIRKIFQYAFILEKVRRDLNLKTRPRRNQSEGGAQ